MRAQRRCLTIGSSDSSGGAGIQADLKAFSALGAYGTTVLVGVTAQDTRGVYARHEIPAAVIRAQIDAVLTDIGADGIKVGTTWSASTIEVICDRIAAEGCPIIVDPVMGTASGARLGDSDTTTIDVIRRRLLPLANVVTPNLFEARVLTGFDNATARELATELVALGAGSAIVTDALPGGGDWLFDGVSHLPISGTRHTTRCEHGAGCTYAAVMTVLLAGGMELRKAAREAHRMTSTAIEHGETTIGHGMHPVDAAAAVTAKSTLERAVWQTYS